MIFMEDKFILMDLNDERSGKVAEVLKNKTCKKIIDYLGDVWLKFNRINLFQII